MIEPTTVEVFPWNDNFATGIAEIDAQHRRLVDLLNRLVSHLAYQSPAPTLLETFEQLTSYATFHFEAEEAIWGRCFEGDPWERWHRHAHEDFSRRVQAVAATAGERPVELVLTEIVTFLTHWLALHIVESDQRMAKVVLALPSGLSLQKAKELADEAMRGSSRTLIDAIMGMYDRLASRTVELTREIRRRAEVEQELLAAHAALAEERRKSDAANQAKTDYVTRMSHEIRTPLAAIHGSVRLLLRDATVPSQVERLEHIERASQHLTSVVDAILDLASIEAGRLELASGPVRVDAIFADVERMLVDRAVAKGLAVRYAAPPRHALRGDATRIRQALINYVGNAIKFTAAGGVDVRCVVLEERPTDVMLRFEVDDTGPGFAADVRERLFHAFERGDAAAAGREGGSGLGLDITRRLAERMGGGVGVTSTPGRGSQFWFTVRLERALDAEPASSAANAGSDEDALRARHAGRRVLVADDEPISREVTASLLEDAGLLVDVVAHGAEALERFLPEVHAVVLMDVQMPTMDGLAATRALRLRPGGASVPIIAMTAGAFQEDRVRCQEAGMDDFLPKPSEPEELFAAVLRWLERGRRE